MFKNNPLLFKFKKFAFNLKAKVEMFVLFKKQINNQAHWHRLKF